MKLWRNFRLRTKVNAILVLILAGLLSTSLVWQFRQHQGLIFSEASEKAHIIIAEATRTREYISAQLQEGQIELNKDRYGMIPVVVANRIGQVVADDLTYSIRHTSNRYRNPANAPDNYEREALRRFAVNTDVTHIAELTETDGIPVFRYLQAAYVDESCLECHGDPQQSPLFLRDIYPPQQDPSYNYQVGDLIGAISVVIPIAQVEKRLAGGFKNTLITTAGFFCVLFICLGILMQKTVIAPLRALAEAIVGIRKTGRFTAALSYEAHDEIGDLVASFNDMVSELKDKTTQLEESERRFRLMTEIAHDAIVAFLPNGQIFLFNQRAENLFGYRQDELLGEPLDRIVSPQPELYGPSFAAFIVLAKQQRLQERHLFKGLRRDQSTVDLEMSLQTIDTGERPFYMALLREVPANS